MRISNPCPWFSRESIPKVRYELSFRPAGCKDLVTVIIAESEDPGFPWTIWREFNRQFYPIADFTDEEFPRMLDIVHNRMKTDILKEVGGELAINRG